jgi:D-amino-acid dehydrogenase
VTRETQTERVAVKRVIVVGAGVVGLSCASSLQDYGVEVEVLDRHRVGSGSSWGNAGILSPALTVPLPEPSILRYGLRAVFDPRSPVALPMPPSSRTLAFLARMVRNCTTARWERAMAVYRVLNEQVFSTFDRQHEGGVDAQTTEADFTVAFRDPSETKGILAELQGVAATGQAVEYEVMSGAPARAADPHLSSAVSSVVVIRNQRYLTPSAYVSALADHVRRRGATVNEESAVTGVERRGGAVVLAAAGRRLEADAVVLAAGSWLSPLARAHGVRVPVQAGRGYSFTVACPEPLRGPLYFPTARVAVTPDGGRARLAGIMEFADADAPPRRGRIPAMVRSVRPLLDGLDLEARSDEWVGPRPLTPDGLPVVGATRTPGVFVAGGHGMWGVTLAPLTGQLLAELIVTGRSAPELAALDPLRSGPGRTARWPRHRPGSPPRN